MTKTKLIFLFVFTLSLTFAVYCDNREKKAKEKREYCDNARTELKEVTAPKLIEIYERYYQRGSCTEDSDCTGLQPLLNCTGNGRGYGCQDIFYQDLVEEYRKETHDMNQKCISDYDFCGSLWPLDVPGLCIPLNLKCVENQCVNVFI